MGEESKLEVKKSYPGVLVDITSENDDIRGVYKARFKYRVYLSTSEWVEVFDDFYWWNCINYKKYTLDKVTRVMGVYNLILIPKDYRNEIVFTKTCKWLIGTRVEISPYRYNGKRYRVVCTERNDEHRINLLWNCLRQNDVDSFFCRLRQEEEESKRTLKELNEWYEKTLKQRTDNFSVFEDDDRPITINGIEENKDEPYKCGKRRS